MKQKSLKLNMFLNVIRCLMGILFPLITFPYISKVLGVENIGKFSFASSIINYFVLLAGLGIATYAIREGAYVKDDFQKLQKFSNEMFSINVISTLFSYALLAITIWKIPKMQNYKILLIILSLQIGFKTLGVEWIYSIHEDYIYITTRSIVFQLLSFALIFAIVKSNRDINKYATITVFASIGMNFLNYIHSKKYLNIRLVKKIEWKLHLKPILVLFATSVMVTVYVSSDTTILGFLCNDEIVGIYSVSTKIYTIVKTVLSSIIIVSIPRISALSSSENRIIFSKVASEIYEILLTITLPVIVGIILLREPIVLIISSGNYIRATSSLFLLSIALFFCIGAYFWGQCILVPLKKENKVFKITVLSAMMNILLNLALIPLWQENAAAFTTIIAECISYIYCIYWGRKEIRIHNLVQTVTKISIGCVGIFIVVVMLRNFIMDRNLYIIISIIGAVLIYGIIELVLKNRTVWEIVNILKKGLRKI